MKYILPPEGALTHLEEATAESLALKPLIGKMPPPAAQKQVTILHGGPGSGKTTLGWDVYNALPEAERQATVYLSYDEHGALFDIPGFADSLGAAHTLAERTALWSRYRADSQYIRARTANHAIQAGLSLFIDTTSSSEGTLKLCETLRGQAYRYITMVSAYAPLPLAAARFLDRPRPGDPAEIVSKRIGALRMLPKMAIEADAMRLFYSGVNGVSPVEVIRCHKGSGRVGVNIAALGDIKLALLRDSAFERVGTTEYTLSVSPADRATLYELGHKTVVFLNDLAFARHPSLRPGMV